MYDTVFAISVELLRGRVLQARDVTVSADKLIDWRETKSGETMNEGASAFDNALLFAALVGEDAARAAAEVEPAELPVPRVREFMANHAGARRRAFDVGPFTVLVEPHSDDDEAQASFARALAKVAATIPV